MTIPADPLATQKALAVRWLDLVAAGDVETLCALTPPELGARIVPPER
jgi:hypothetical protein